jgi:Lrp/AsnC family transcriptional regulator, leucine-responsive regulatory protein
MSIKRQKERTRDYSKGQAMKRLRDRNIDLDAVDARILTALSADARVSVAELARLVGLSAPSAAERVKRLEESGVIEGYAASIDPRALGLTVAAWLRVRPVPGGLSTVAEILRTLPEIVECDRVTGEDCFVARAHVKSIEDLERLIDQIIPHAMTTTSIIQSTLVKRRPPRIVSNLDEAAISGANPARQVEGSEKRPQRRTRTSRR